MKKDTTIILDIKTTLFFKIKLALLLFAMNEKWIDNMLIDIEENQSRYFKVKQRID